MECFIEFPRLNLSDHFEDIHEMVIFVKTTVIIHGHYPSRHQPASGRGYTYLYSVVSYQKIDTNHAAIRFIGSADRTPIIKPTKANTRFAMFR